jgi:hypothetical protein
VDLTYEFLLANFPILPILLIIILAVLTVDAKLILSVDLFFILNILLFFSFTSSPGPPVRVVVVLSVSARETSLLIAPWLATAKGA